MLDFRFVLKSLELKVLGQVILIGIKELRSTL